MGRLCIQRNSSTPLLHGFACISLVPLLPSTWWAGENKDRQLDTWWSHSLTKIVAQIIYKTMIFLKIFHDTYLMPLLMVSVGAQLTVSTQSVKWYCLLSRNQPESDRPRTCIPVCPSPSSSSATLSTFSNTPVPPALHAENLISTYSVQEYEWMIQFQCYVKNVHTWTYLLPASKSTLALSRPLFSRSFTTSWIISEPMKA